MKTRIQTKMIASAAAVILLLTGCIAPEVPKETKDTTQVVSEIEETQYFPVEITSPEEVTTGTRETEPEEVTAGAPETEETTAQTTEEILRALEQDVFTLTNQCRVENGLEPLLWKETIYPCAQRRAEEAMEVWAHERPDGSRYDTVYQEFAIDRSKNWVGENLARGYPTAEETVEAFMNSTTHRENILFSEFTHIAIAAVELNPGYYYVCQAFWG